MRHRHGQPGIDYQIIPPNPQPRGVPNGFPRTCYHGWLPGICSHPVCRFDPRETGPYRGGEILRLPRQPPPKVYYVDRRRHGHPLHGGMTPPYPHHFHHGDLHYHPHGGYDIYGDDEEDDWSHEQFWGGYDDDVHSAFSGSELSTIGMLPTYNPYSGHGGYGPHHAGLHIPLSHGHHHDHHYEKSLGSSFGTEESY